MENETNSNLEAGLYPAMARRRMPLILMALWLVNIGLFFFYFLRFGWMDV